MKKRIVIISILLLGLLVHTAVAGHVMLRPTGFLSYRQAADKPVSGGALKFDISQVPKDCRIDLAELSIRINADTSLGKSFDFFVNVATSEWASSPLASTIRPTSPDSLLIGSFAASGDGVPVEINVTKLVKLWHSGKLANNGLLISIPGDGRKAFALATKGGEIEVTLSVFFSKKVEKQ